jgi:hypothetical protein
LAGVLHLQQQVVVGGEKDERADPDGVQPLGSPEDSGAGKE